MNKKDYWSKIQKSERIILDLCGGTGAWSKPYKDAGYHVVNITLPEFDVFDSEIMTIEKFKLEVNDIIDMGTAVIKFPTTGDEYNTSFFYSIDKIYGILAAPTCTHFSLARTTAKTPRDLRGAFALVQKCLDIIHACAYNETLQFWALENPMGLLRQFLGKPPLTVNPFEYAGYADNPESEAYTKKTDIWGFYNMPVKKEVPLTEEQKAVCSNNNRRLPKIPETYVCDPDMTRQAIRRSITPSGFARAFFNKNK